MELKFRRNKKKNISFTIDFIIDGHTMNTSHDFFNHKSKVIYIHVVLIELSTLLAAIELSTLTST